MNERQIFEAALDIPDSIRREAFLSQACGDDAALQARVEALLTAHAAASQFLETPAVEQLNTPPNSSGEDTLQLPPSHVAEGDSDPEIPSGPDLSFLSPSTKPGSIGTLGHYEILNVLGQGAFGIVFRAFDEKLHRHVAIKTMSVQMAATSPPRKRFLREARAAAAIRHDNVTQVYSVEEQPLPYLVMEFIDGQTLQQKQRDSGPLDVPELLHIGRQIAGGLAAAHAQSLIHRDVKPGNILLEQGAEQKVKITDFGLARAADDASLTRSGMISGTPLYMSPEQALGQSLDPRSDLFSLGSVLYELATGRPPFRAPTTVAVLRRVVDDTPRPIQELIPETPDWLVAIINKLLSKKPDDRYQSAKEVGDLMSRCQSELQLTGQVTCVTPHRAGSVNVRSTPAETNTFPAPAKDSGGSRPPLADDSTGEATPEKPYPRIRSWPVVLSVVLVMGIQLVGLMLQTNRTTTLALSIGAMLLSVLLGVGELFSFRKRQLEFREGSASALPEKKLTANKIIFALLVGVLVMSPILYGRHLSDRFNAWLWPAIPALPAIESTAGLNFDGKDDHVEFAPVDWSYPQFTIEAFVTSTLRSDNGITVSLTSGGKPWEFMELYDGPHNSSGQRQSGAQIMGKTPIATAYGPLTPGERQHRALVFDGSHMHYYINGIWQGKRRAEAYEGEKWKRWNLKQLRLGCDGDGKKRFEGRIDQVRISKVARYNDNFAPVTSVANDEQTLALYNFDEGQGDVLKDTSGHGHDGKIIGATWVDRSGIRQNSAEPEDGRSLTTSATPTATVSDAGHALNFKNPADIVNVSLTGFDLSKPWTIETWCRLDTHRSTKNGTVLKLGPVFLTAYEKHWAFIAGQVNSNGDGQWGAYVQLPHSVVPTHLVAQWNGQVSQFFVNGVPVSTAPLTWGTSDSVTEINRKLFTSGHSGRMSLGNAYLPNPPTALQGTITAVRVSQGVQYTGPFTPSPLTKTLDTIALYDFAHGSGDVLKDISGNGNDGKIVGATWVHPASGVASAPQVLASSTDSGGSRPPLATLDGLTFNGLDQWVQIPSLKYDGTSPLTMEIVCTVSSEQPKSMSALVTTNSMEESTQWTSLYLKGRTWGQFRSPNDISNSATFDQPVCLTGIWDGQVQRLYVNGKKAAEGPSPAYSESNPFLIGCEVGVQNAFRGTIHELRISGSARHTEDYSPAMEFEADPDTLALYKFNEGAGDVLKDISGNGHDGKIIGAKWVQASVRREPDGSANTTPTMPKSVATTPSPPAADLVSSERQVAEWILKNGGAVHLVDRGLIGNVADLPPDPMTVFHVIIRNQPKFTKADGVRLSQLRGLHIVGFIDSTLEPGSIAALARIRSLQELGFSRGMTSNATLSEVLAIPQLRTLELGQLAVADDLLAKLGSLPQLQALQMYACPQVTESGLIRLAASPPPNLQRLEWAAVKLSAAGMKAIASLPHPQTLRFTSMELSDTALSELADCPSLSEIVLDRSTGITAGAINDLQQKLSGCQVVVTDPEPASPIYGPAYRDTIRKLMSRGFSIGINSNSSLGMTWIQGDTAFPPGDVVFAQHIIFQNLNDQTVPEIEDLQLLAQLTDLPRLGVSRLPAGGLRELLPLKNLTLLMLGTSQLTEADFALLPTFRKLSDLLVVIPNKAALETVATLPHLSRLTFGAGSTVADGDLKVLESVRTLSTLDFVFTTISREAAQAFANARPDVIVYWKDRLRLDPIIGWPADAPAPAIAPFDAEQAKKHQEAWAGYLKVPAEYTNSIGMKFRLIPPGEFLMGSTKDEIEATARILDDPQWLETLNAEAPQHKVILTRPFYLGVHEVTQGQFSPVMGNNPSFFSATGEGKNAVVGIDTTRFPVEMVSWDQATEYCRKLSQSEQPMPTATEGDLGYRLPTEAEWEWACRAGTLTPFCTGEGEADLQKGAWFEANSQKLLHPVGEREASPFGLHDTHGNVWEWVQDGWAPMAYAKSGDQPAQDPVILTAFENKRMYRGGSWFVNALSCRSASHRAGPSTYQSYFVGFRVALSVEAIRAALKVTGPGIPKAAETTPSTPND